MMLEIVLQAVFLTSVVVISLFIFTLQSKRDFHKFYAILMTLSMVLISAMLLQLFIASPLQNKNFFYIHTYVCNVLKYNYVYLKPQYFVYCVYCDMKSPRITLTWIIK